MSPNKMERFTQRARRVLVLAQEEAERLQHNTIGSEHLLLGLLREIDGKGGRVLREAGLEYDKVAEAVPGFPQQFRGTTLDLSDDTKRVLELATETVRERKQLYVGTEHLVMGILKYPECRAFELLQRFSIQPEDLRQRVLKILEENPVQPSRPPNTLSDDERQNLLKTVVESPAPASPPPDEQAPSAVRRPGDIWIEPTQSQGGTLRDLRLLITEKGSDEVKTDVTLPAEAIKKGLQLVFSMMPENRWGKFTFEAGDYKIQVELMYTDEGKEAE